MTGVKVSDRHNPSVWVWKQAVVCAARPTLQDCMSLIDRLDTRTLDRPDVPPLAFRPLDAVARPYAVKPIGEMPPHPSEAAPPSQPHVIHLRNEYRVTNLGTLLDVLV